MRRNHKPYGPYRIENRHKQIKAHSYCATDCATDCATYCATDNSAAAIACRWSSS